MIEEQEDLKEIQEMMRLDRFLGMIRRKSVNLSENLKKEFKHVELQSFIPHLGEDDWQKIPLNERLAVLELLNDPEKPVNETKVKDDSKGLREQVLASTKLTSEQWQNLDPDSQKTILKSLSKLDDYATKSKSRRNIEKLSDPVKKVINLLSQEVWDKLPESAHQAILLKLDKLEKKIKK